MSTTERVPMADARSWWALGIVAAVALFTTLNWPALAWVWGAIVVLLFLRAGALVLAARNASADPEEALLEELDEKKSESAPLNG